jgi:hypothetical protein
VTNFLSTTGYNCKTMTSYGLKRKLESKDEMPSPLGYGFIFKISSFNSSSMELSSNIAST